MAKLIPSAEIPKPENIGRIVTGPKSENRSIRKSRSIICVVPAYEPGPILRGLAFWQDGRRRCPRPTAGGYGSGVRRDDKCEVRAASYPATLAALSCTDSPQPQAPVWFGLLKMNCDCILSAL